MNQDIADVTVAVAAPDDATPSPGGRVQALLARFATPATAIAIVDLAVIVLFCVITPNHVFFTTATFTNVTLSAAEGVILGVGAAFLLGAGEFDLSLGPNVILSSVLGAIVMKHLDGGAANVITAPATALVLGLVVCVAAGTGYGVINGLIVTKLHVNALIGTLGTMGIGTGIAYVLCNGTDLSVPSELQSAFGIRTVVSVIPLAAIIALLIVVIGWVMLTQTRFGLLTLATGSSREAAIRSGVPVNFHVLRLFVLAGFLCGIASILDITRYATTNITGHTTDSLSAIAGAVIGGTSLFGGRVSIVGMVFGCLLPIILSIGLVQVGLQAFYQEVAVGVVLIVAVAVRSRQSDSASGTGLLRLRRRSAQ